MAKIADVTFTGQSGREYKFGVYPRETTFKDVGGVYVFSKRDSQRNHTLLYIGQTHSFEERRLAHHEKWECADPLGGNVICTHLENNETQRKAKERDLIDKYQPPCNKQ